MSSGNNSWEEDFNSATIIPRRYFLTKLRQPFKSILNCCKLQIVFKTSKETC